MFLFFLLSLFLLHAMKAYKECLHSFFTSVLDGAEWPASRLSRFTPAEKIPCAQWLKRWVGSRGVLDVLEKRKYLSPAETQYLDRPAHGVDSISITGLQTIKWTNWNTVAANTDIFPYFTFENMHLPWKYKNPLPITRQDQLGKKYSKRINLL